MLHTTYGPGPRLTVRWTDVSHNARSACGAVSRHSFRCNLSPSALQSPRGRQQYVANSSCFPLRRTERRPAPVVACSSRIATLKQIYKIDGSLKIRQADKDRHSKKRQTNQKAEKASGIERGKARKVHEARECSRERVHAVGCAAAR